MHAQRTTFQGSSPIIGITTYGRDAEKKFSLPAVYVDAVRRAGGIPVLIPPGEAQLPALLTQLDGVILAGGGDLDPDLYEGDDHEAVYMVDPERDSSEIELARRIVRDGTPTLAICRGVQVVNVALGGSLIEHLPDEVGADVVHRMPHNDFSKHPVRVNAASRLGHVLQTAETSAASWHHQALRRVATTLDVVATASDGTVEAVEMPGHPWLLAVQWHPEVTAADDPVQQRLFDALVAAARGRAEFDGRSATDNGRQRSGSMRLKNKVALITGGSGGIGRETALLFSQEGANVVVADVNDAGGAQTVQMVEAQGGRATYVHADVSRASDCQEMVRVAEASYGKLDVLFNNAGIMHGEDEDAVATEENVWDLTMSINLKGVYLGCKYGIPALRRAGGGSIINTASFVAIVGAATPQLAYTASKGGVLAMTRELAVVHARENIRVNALCPGPLRTELLMNFLNTEEKKQRRLVHVPMGRFGEAAEMAQAALYLASDESSYVTGTDFVVDGGLTAAYVTPE